MTRHIITILLLCHLLPANALAGSYYYTKPDATSLPPSGRILMYDPNTGTDKNITGQVLHDQVQPSTDEILTAIGQPTDTPLTVKPSATADQYQRKTEFYDKNGVIKMYINASGTVVITGQLVLGSVPLPLAVVSVYPANGATGVAIDTNPYVALNKAPLLSVANLYINGNNTPPSAVTTVCVSGCGEGETPVNEYRYTIPAAPLNYNTTYTIKFAKNAVVQTDGETTSSCGPMTEVAGICQSTFTTARAPLSIVSTYPGPGAANVPGTPGQVMDPDIAIEFDRPLTDYSAVVTDMVVTASKWNGTAYVNYTLSDYPAISPDSLVWNGGAQYMASTDSSHLTTYTIQIKKRIGLTSCPSAWTDTGTICQYQFTTAP